MKLSKIIKNFSAVFSAAALFGIFGCSMEIDQNSAASSITDISRALIYQEISQMTFMGGSALYSPKDANANQISKGVVIATRIGEVYAIDLGSGKYSYQNSKVNFEYGFIKITDVSKGSISFSYAKFNGSKNASPAGSFTLSEGKTADLNGDGISDIIWRKPDAGHKGRKNNMWLTFLCSTGTGSESGSSSMFSIIPMQYSRSTYPNGMLGINSNGQYVINMYDVGTSNRAAISEIGPGDYIFDMEKNTIGMYTGEERSGRNARAIEDAEFEKIEPVTESSTASDFEYKPYDFTGEYDINTLLSLLPKSVVSQDYANKSLSENVDYLNTLIKDSAFIAAVMQENPGEVAEEIRAQLATPISSDVELVIFNRHALSLFFPDDCPDVNIMASTLAGALPWFSCEIGAVPEMSGSERSLFDDEIVKIQKKIEECRRTGGESKSESIKKELEEAYHSQIEKYMKEAEQECTLSKDIYTEDYILYNIKREAYKKYISKTSLSFNVAPLAAGLSGQKWLVDIIRGANGELTFGINASISFADANPDIYFKTLIYTQIEAENKLAFTVYGTSLFSSKTPDKLTPEQTKEYLKQQHGIDADEDGFWDVDKMFKDETITSGFGIDHWYFKWKSEKKVFGDYKVRATEDAKAFHRFIQPVKAVPIGVTMDFKFDILFSSKAVVYMDDILVGGCHMEVHEVRCGVDWGFRDWFTCFGKRIAPKIWTFYSSPFYANNYYAENNGFAGFTKINRENATMGGGVQVIFTPVLEARLGIGIGFDLAVASADMSAGVWGNAFMPLIFEAGITANAHKLVDEGSVDLDINTSFTALLGLSWGLDLQLCLDPPALDKKYWTYDIPGLGSTKMFQICKFDMKNFELVNSEGFKELE